ncbi:SRPBCC family protein [Neobacillus sp. MM2021_6]|uniref:CoxG family protein n=1 Tax=Bacillaceae TaxID=186817 RepID=UPI0014090D33|nr:MULTISPECIES: SRPBCC family protein [Bacillaceae]MBO0959943.1 SRPBCC family protein [Neobacillus sp. MM2021_6]NHC18892.1 SRPBCC family protein [Bacillus sp. MM2020_4]
MATGSHTVEIPVEVQAVWDYVSDLEKWATSVPAYKEHEIINAKQSIWTFEGSVKNMKKTIQAQVDITEWNEPSTIKFELTGLSDNFTGSGHFAAENVNGKTVMTCTVDVRAGGITGTVLTPVIKWAVPKVASRLTESIARKIAVFS